MTLIDTAEIYGDGRAEELIKHVMADQRDRVFLVSKVANNHVIGDGIALACEASLARLGTDHLDLYLLHWPAAGAAYSEVVACPRWARSALGAYPTSQSPKWKISSVFHAAIVARPIRSATAWRTGRLKMTC